MKKEISLENLKSLLLETNNNEDVLTFFNRWRNVAETSDVRNVRKEIVTKCGCSENYVFCFCSNPPTLYPAAREKYLPVMRAKMLEIFKQKCEEAAERNKCYLQLIQKIEHLVN